MSGRDVPLDDAARRRSVSVRIVRLARMAPAGEVDSEFLALPLRRLAQAALRRTADFGAEHADFRLERIRSQRLVLRDHALVDASESDAVGFAVRVIVDGAWGFASGTALTVDEAVRVAEQAVRLAQIAKPLALEPITIAAEPVYDDAVWVSSYDVDPFTVDVGAKVDLLAEWSRRLGEHQSVDHVAASVHQVRENKFYADSHGTTTTQQRVRLNPVLEIHGADRAAGVVDSMRSI